VAKAGFENAFREHWKLSPKAERSLGQRTLPGCPFLGPRNWVYTTCLGHKSMYVSIWVQICQRSHQEWVSCAPDILGWDLNVKLALVIL